MSIKRKILFIVLGMSIISLTAFSIAAFSGLLGIRTQMQHSSKNLGEFAVDNSGEVLEREALDKLDLRARSQAQIINERLLNIAETTIYFSAYVEGIYINAENLSPVPIPYSTSENNGILTMQLQSADGKADYPVIKQEADLLGNISVAFESNRNAMDVTAAIYLGTESGFSILYDPFSADENQSFDARTRPWYIGAKQTRDVFWTDPYIDAASGKLIITCSYPFYGADGEFMGCIGTDVIIEDLNNAIVNTDVGENGYAFVINTEGVLISSKELKKTADGSYEKKSAYKEDNAEYNQIIKNMTEGKTSVDKVDIDGEGVYIAYSQIPAANWSVGMVRSASEIMELVIENSHAIQNMTQETLGYVDSTIKLNVMVFMIVFILVVIAVIFFSGRLSSKIIQPIITLEERLGHIARGELDITIEIKTGDEIEQLGDSVNSMTLKLKEYIDNLTTVTADRERIASDLRIATDIQADMLPKIFPPFSNRDDLHIAPFMLPAKEVGGDFYDFFFLDDEQKKIALVIADVSGKGVPAALFMVISKVLIKNNRELPCDEILSTVNNLLAADNNSSMFVTTFFSILDLETGEYNYVSAGHNPPVLYSKESGELTYLSLPRTPPLAIFPGKRFPCQTITMQKGDVLLLYTDGVTEAFNNQSEMYGSERLLENLKLSIDKPVEDIVEALYGSIHTFAANEPQSDDITMLCCKFFGKDEKN